MTIVITDDTTPAELAECIALLNADAKSMRRRGRIGTATPAYDRVHECIDAMVTDYLALTKH